MLGSRLRAKRPGGASRGGLLASRWIRTSFDPADFGLVPTASLDPGRAGPEPDPAHEAEAQKAADAAWDGDWRVAAAYCEAAGRDWDERWSRIELLIHVADSDDRWLTDWRAAQPDNGDAGTVHAMLLVRRAWKIRGIQYAHRVPEENMQQFLALLPTAMAAARQAAERAPRDPGPWVVMVTAARGMGYSHSQFADLWRNLQLRAPHHVPAHTQALQYWCAKWSGSDKSMFDFAARAVMSAPPGSPLPGLYLQALYEVPHREGMHGKFGSLAEFSVEPRLRDVALHLDTLAPDHEDLPELRHHLAHHLLVAGMPREALEQFRRIGPYCGASPWNLDPAGAAAAFDHARGRAAYGSRG
ncbi:hypothetical protein [Streptomyces sp. NBC_00503]|uniref:hypothetical protein n=1 Tax=Streptomyces sp. NBC_00503 TaxID=2903659 RepID=UPI002E818F7C|nr:hypothetical protein [Streptomyces sp. NBC_00503]WUD85373.1 hypothetical protein OG490_35075 [Streptomyces sp. NBC_00503]